MDKRHVRDLILIAVGSFIVGFLFTFIIPMLVVVKQHS